MSGMLMMALLYLFGAVLHFILYISFLRWAHMPRLWLPVRIGDWIQLGIATGVVFSSLIYVSNLTYGGITLLVLLSLFQFVFVVTPAFDFFPTAGPAVGFVARHSHVALVLLVPIGTVVLINNQSLVVLGFLTSMLLVEIAWFVKSQSLKGRTKYVLDAIDTQALHTQSNNNPAVLKKKFAIKELQIEGDRLSWLGCNKNTIPCPLNLYIKRLGLNTPPCCREHLQYLSEFAADIFEDMELTYWLDGGSLLGAIREKGQLIRWEDDIDISVLLDDSTSWQDLFFYIKEKAQLAGLYVVPLRSHEYISISYDTPSAWPFRYEHNRMHAELRVDINVYRKTMSFGEEILERKLFKASLEKSENGHYGLPASQVLPTSRISFLGREYSAPHDSHEYLKSMYGDYSTPEYLYINDDAASKR